MGLHFQICSSQSQRAQLLSKNWKLHGLNVGPVKFPRDGITHLAPFANGTLRTPYGSAGPRTQARTASWIRDLDFTPQPVSGSHGVLPSPSEAFNFNRSIWTLGWVALP